MHMPFKEFRESVYYDTRSNSDINLEVDKESQRAKAGRLRDAAPLRAVLDIVASDSDLRRNTAPLLSKAEEFKLGTIRLEDQFGIDSQMERFRNFTPLMAALRSNERTSQLLDLATDIVIEQDRNNYWEKIKNGEDYVREMVIGTGANTANYLSTRAVLSERNSSVAISSDFGGEFSLVKEAAWNLNSRNRKTDRDIEPIPGTEGSLNELGKYATVQPSDYGYSAYQNQIDLSHAIKDNLVLLGTSMAEVKVVEVARNTNPQKKGILKIKLQNLENEEFAYIYADRTVEISGVGEPLYAYTDTSDVETSDIIAQEKEVFESKKGKPKVLHFNDFIQYSHQPDNPFPLEGIKDVVIVGDNDSALVAWGILMGYEPVPGKTVRQITETPRITIVAPDAPTSREEMLSKVRPRYSQVANELLRDKDEQAFYTTRGRKGKVKSLDVTNATGKECIDVQTTAGTIEDADLVIFATGFKEANQDIYRPLNNELITNKQEIKNRLTDIIYHEGSKVYFRGNRTIEIMNLELSPENGQVVTFKETDRDGRSVEGKFQLVTPRELQAGENNGETLELFKKTYFDINSITKVEYESGIAPEDIVIKDKDGTPIAKKRDGAPVYKIGASAKLPLKPKIRGAAASIPENAASIFVTSETVSEVARFFSEKDNKAEYPETFTETPTVKETKQLEYINQTKTSSELSFAIPDVKNTLPLDLSTRDAIKVAIRTLLAPYTFTTEVKDISILYYKLEDKKNEFGVAIKSNLTQNSNKEILNALNEDPLFMELALRAINYKGGARKPLEITIPFTTELRSDSETEETVKRAKIDTGNIDYKLI